MSRAQTAVITGSFVGRELYLRDLSSTLAETLTGRSRLVLLCGEPGIGKTRLAEEFGDLARARGADVLWGRCWDGDGAPAYWPWTQVLREHGATFTLREVHSGPDAQPAIDGEQARFLLFDNVATFLRNASVSRPVVLVFDDLQWADVPSLLLLKFCLSSLRDARVMFLGTYRDVEADANPPLSGLIGSAAALLVLEGLGRGEVEALVGAGQPRQAVDEIFERTRGNPFFVRELVRLLAARGSPAPGLPQSIREVIDRRLARLSDPCHDLLRVASVAGQEFGIDLMEAATGSPPQEILELLEEAAEARVLEHGEPFGRYEFSHALVREALYDALGTARRAEAHRRIGEAIESRHSSRLDAHYAELAHHFMRASPAGEDARAQRYARLAGDRALALLAYEEAARCYERALAVTGDPGARCELVLSCAEAERRAGAVADAKERCLQAAASARRIGRGDLLARAALEHGAAFGGFGIVDRADEALISLLSEALEALAEGEIALRCRLTARLAVELYFTDDTERRLRLGAEAVELARRLRDPALELVALHSHNLASWSPDGVEERLHTAARILRLAAESGDGEMTFQGHLTRIICFLELGDMRRVDVEIEACSALARRLRMPVFRWHVACLRTMRALAQGNFDEAARLANEALEIGQLGRSEAAVVIYTGQMFSCHWAAGRLEELEPGLRALADHAPRPSWRAALAWTYRELGRTSDARDVFESLALHDFADLTRDGNWLLTVSLCAMTCAYLGDARRAELLYALLSPYADRCVAVGSLGTLGSAALPLGMLAATMRRAEDAERHFRHAIAANKRGRVPVWEAVAQVECAAMLLEDGGGAGADRARELLDGASSTAATLNVRPLLRRIEDIRTSANLFLRDGDGWRITFAGRTIHLADAKGLHDIARLVATPDTELAVEELVGDGSSVNPRTAVAMRVRSALDRIEREHPDLGRHLRRSVRTGARCAYSSPDPVRWCV